MGTRTLQLWLSPRHRKCAVAALLLTGVAAAPIASAWAEAPPPSEATRQQVRQLVREAGQLVDRGDRAAAVTRLQQAQALWPDPSLDYNLGITYAELGQHPQAARALGRFLDGADRGAVLGERFDDAKRRLADYQRTLSRLKVQAALPVQAPSATLFVDAEQPGTKDTTTALPMAAPLWLVPGAHSVRVTARGARDYEVQVELRPGELRQLSAELLPAVALSNLVPASPELRHESESTAPYKKWWFWPVIGGSAAVLTVSIGLIAAGAAGKLSHVAAGSDLDPVDVDR